MKRTFVYRAPTENRPPPTSASTGDCHRKRKRSPESSDHVASTKKLMEGDLANDEEALPGGDDDYLDKIGTAAIELYELTQRDPQQLSVDSTSAAPPASIPRPEDTAALVHAGLEQQQQQRPARRGTALAVGASAPIAGTTTLPPNRPAYAPSQQQQQTQQQQPATTLVIAHSNSRAPLPATAPQPSELLDKIRELQEVNYRKDGETKVLRSEKERLAEELRKKEEAARDIQTRLLSEKEELEQRYAREKEALATTLKFNEQELSSLQEKCRLLEDRLKRSNQPPSSAKPASPAVTKVPPLDVKDGVGSIAMDFMSAEANALSSQTTSLLTAGVVVGTKRPSSMLEPSFNSFKAPNQDQHHKKPPVHTPPPSSSYKPHLSSNGGLAHPLEIHAVYHVKQEEGTTVPATLTTTVPATLTTTVIATPTTHPVTVTPTLPILKEDALKVEVAQPDYDWDYKPVALDIPELSGPQLLMLLANPSLNRPAVAMEISSGPQSTHKHTKSKPVQRTWSHMAGLGDEEEHEDTPLHEPWSPEAPQKLTGLLSLLHLKTPSSIFPVNTRALSATVYPGEVKGDHLRPDSLMKKIRQASGTARKGVTEMEPNPVGRFEPDASSGPAGRGHAHFSSTSTKVLFDPAVEVLGPQTRIAAFEEWNPTKSTSLARGVDPNRLEEHISLILSTADTMGTGPSHFSTTPPSFPPSSTSSSPCRPHPPPDMVGDMAATLLPHLGEVLVRYHGEQFLKTRPPLDAMGQLDFSDGEGAGHLNMSVSMSSRSSGEEQLPRSEVNYKVLLEAVTALETLVVCNRRVRAAILAPPPPPFKLESRPSSVVDQAPVYALRSGGHGPGDSSPGSAVSRECTPVGVRSEGKPSETTPLRAEYANNHFAGVKEAEVWKGKRLVCMANHMPSLSTSVWYGHDEAHARAYDSPPTHGCGHLLQTLIDLVAPPWKETADILRPIVRTLCVLAEDCPGHLIERFCPLLTSDSVNICMDRDDPHLTLDILRLLTSLCECPALVSALTSDHAETCILYTCYQRLVATPPWAISLTTAVQLQAIRLISAVLMAPGGPTVLFEPAHQCPCSFELMKSLTTLLTNTVDMVTKPSQLTGPPLLLVCEVVHLLHTISQEDPYFDSHRQECQHAYTFSLHRLGWLMAGKLSHSELEMVKELRDYCEGEEDSDSEEWGGGQ